MGHAYVIVISNQIIQLGLTAGDYANWVAWQTQIDIRAWVSKNISKKNSKMKSLIHVYIHRPLKLWYGGIIASIRNIWI